MKSTNQNLTDKPADPIKGDAKMYGTRNRRDNSHANYMVVLNMICSKFDIHKAESIDFDLADELAYEIAGKVPSDVVLDGNMSVNEILQWAETKPGPHLQAKQPEAKPSREIPNIDEEAALKLTLRDKIVLATLGLVFIATVLSLIL